MKKLSEGKYEILTSKADAIDKFMQLQGICREELSDGQCILFYCTKKGKITVHNPQGRHYENQSSTRLCANVTEQGGKTYVTYYTAFSRFVNISKLISLVLDIIVSALCLIMIIMSGEKSRIL